MFVMIAGSSCFLHDLPVIRRSELAVGDVWLVPEVSSIYTHAVSPQVCELVCSLISVYPFVARNMADL